MFHGLNNSFLYSAQLLECTFADAIGNEKTIGGTGFWLKNGSTISLITNRHVLDLEYYHPKYKGYSLQSLVVVGKVQDENGAPEIEQRLLIKNHAEIQLSTTKENDIAAIIKPEVDVVGGGEIKPILGGVDRNLLATTEDLTTKISVCDFVAYPGFPPWYDKRGGRPILRTGTISSDPRYDYSWKDDYVGECIAFEAFSFGGSSGSPVFAVQKGPEPGPGINFPGFRELKMVGINAGHLPTAKDQHSGISYMFKSSAVLDLLDEAK